MPRSRLICAVAFAHLALLLAGCPWQTLQPPAEPQSAMSEDARVNPLSVALDWLDAARATSYDVCFGVENPPPLVGTTAESTWVLDALAYDTTYYWQIVAINAAGQTPGPVWSFTTEVPPPEVPTTPNPADGAMVSVSETVLDWADTARAESYDVRFGVENPPPLVGMTSQSVWVLSTLVPETTYHWQVVAKNSAGETPGPVWSFTTQVMPPDMPATPNPADGATNVSVEQDLDWADAARADTYDVYFGTESPPPFVGTTTESAWVLDTLAGGTTYHWQITARNDGGSTVGPIWGFTTLAPQPPPAVTIETILIGDPGNPGDARYASGGVPSFGGVDYVYGIGKFEVTARQYTAFLNAVAATDTYRLYNWSMVFDGGGCKIKQSGSSGSLTYSVAPDYKDRPVNYLSWGDAARFCNWLHNGQPTGAQGPGTTEDGSYLLNGATSTAALMAVRRTADATWVIPTEDEWYKAAYHKNDGATDHYFDYPTSSDSDPDNDLIDPDPGSNATFYDIDDDTFTIGSPYYRTLVGAHGNSDSPCGTFDQGGNVWEWNEALWDASHRMWRGGAFPHRCAYLHASQRFASFPTIEERDLGLRLVRVFPPGPHGACCYPDQGCLVQTQIECTGVWLGAATVCTPNPCLQPTGACCYPDGACLAQTAVDCAGVWQGAWTDCVPNPCPQPTGACCYTFAGCVVQPEADCTGAWQGVGTACDPDPCTTTPLVIETVTIGNPGNPGDERYPSGGVPSFGGVDYVYDMGRYEVTAGQYTVFLNAVAATDTYSLYNTEMWADSEGCRIERSGAPGDFTYSVAPDWADRPVNLVSWGDAARFANWLHNGQPTGPQELDTTEDGSYFLDGATSDAALAAIVRKPEATWVVPSEDEWYKAAYHKNDGVTGDYWNFPACSNIGPSYHLVTPDPGDHATFSNMDNSSSRTIGSPYHRTAVGAHENSEGPYGTFDQGGNVWEWTEGMRWGSHRTFRGGSFGDRKHCLAASHSAPNAPSLEDGRFGFRVAKVIPPGPPGACCYTFGTCFLVQEFECDGAWLGVGSTCVPNACVSSPIQMETVTVGNPGNAGELSGDGSGGIGPSRVCGAVNYVYNIGKYEVTNAQYTVFLNAVAATDTYGLYYGCGIQRSGSPGSYTYSVAADWANRPVTRVSWGDAARFCNWLHNGQPVGAQDLTTTEDGSYFLNGAITAGELFAIVREQDATWVIPTEDEWYKAAYHKNDGATGDYWMLPTSSDSMPSNQLIDPDPGNNANYYGSAYTIGAPYYRTEVGEFENSVGPYGTFDQGGNVGEWTEAIIQEELGYTGRGYRGGAWCDDYLHARYRVTLSPTMGDGFRVVEPP